MIVFVQVISLYVLHILSYGSYFKHYFYSPLINCKVTLYVLEIKIVLKLGFELVALNLKKTYYYHLIKYQLLRLLCFKYLQNEEILSIILLYRDQVHVPQVLIYSKILQVNLE